MSYFSTSCEIEKLYRTAGIRYAAPFSYVRAYCIYMLALQCKQIMPQIYIDCYDYTLCVQFTQVT